MNLHALGERVAALEQRDDADAARSDLVLRYLFRAHSTFGVEPCEADALLALSVDLPPERWAHSYLRSLYATRLQDRS